MVFTNIYYIDKQQIKLIFYSSLRIDLPTNEKVGQVSSSGVILGYLDFLVSTLQFTLTMDSFPILFIEE